MSELTDTKSPQAPTESKPAAELVAKPLQRPQKRFFSLSEDEGIRVVDKGPIAAIAATAEGVISGGEEIGQLEGEQLEKMVKVNVVVSHVVEQLLEEIVRDPLVVALYQRVFGEELLARLGKTVGSSLDAGWGRGILTGKEVVSNFIDEVLSCVIKSRFEAGLADKGVMNAWECFWSNLHEH